METPTTADLQNALAPFRKAGFAIAAFTPDEVGDMDQREIEEAMVTAGNRLIEESASSAPWPYYARRPKPSPAIGK